jgi:hypothetical protein
MKNISIKLALALVVGLVVYFVLPTQTIKAEAEEHKINICHFTHSETNPIEAIRVDTSAFDGIGKNDHTLHADFLFTGPVNEHNDQPLKPEGDEWCQEQRPVDVCSNLEGNQSEVPEGYYAEDGACYINEDPCEGEECEEDPEDPTDPEDPSAKTSVTHIDPQCSGSFNARMELREGNSTPEGVTVRFTYRNETKESKTNKEGKAEASFFYSGDENIKIEADGYPSHDAPVRSAQNCTSGSVLGASTEGKILGASTMAATGSSIMSLIGMIGTTLTLVSAVLYAKKA